MMDIFTRANELERAVRTQRDGTAVPCKLETDWKGGIKAQLDPEAGAMDAIARVCRKRGDDAGWCGRDLLGGEGSTAETA